MGEVRPFMCLARFGAGLGVCRSMVEIGWLDGKIVVEKRDGKLEISLVVVMSDPLTAEIADPERFRAVAAVSLGQFFWSSLRARCEPIMDNCAIVARWR